MIHIGQVIEAELRDQERTVSWLSRRLDCDRTKIYQIFHKPAIKTDMLMKISIVLNKNFFKLLEDDFKAEMKTRR